VGITTVGKCGEINLFSPFLIAHMPSITLEEIEIRKQMWETGVGREFGGGAGDRNVIPALHRCIYGGKNKLKNFERKIFYAPHLIFALGDKGGRFVTTYLPYAETAYTAILAVWGRK